MTTRILVVDDSLIVRRIIVQALEGLPDVAVVGQAADGRAALEQIEALSPDLVTLDIEMPVMDGIEAMRAIKARWPQLPVVMFSTLTERGATMTLEALMAGARDYVTKPTNSTSLSDSLDQVRTELGARIRALAPRAHPASVLAPSQASQTSQTDPTSQSARLAPGPAFTSTAPGLGPSSPSGRSFLAGSTQHAPLAPAGSLRATPTGTPTGTPAGAHLTPGRISAVVIGASTGGPDALARVIGALPKDLSVPVLVVQHMPPLFTATFAARLDRTCALRVVEAQHGNLIVPGTVYLAPGDFHMEITSSAQPAVRLQQGEPENFCRPAVDVLFRSAAATYGKAVLGVVLTGMGSDGAKGSQALVDAGADVYVQDEATSVVYGMPRAVAEAGLAHQQLPCDQVAPAILARVRGQGSPR